MATQCAASTKPDMDSNNPNAPAESHESIQDERLLVLFKMAHVLAQGHTLECGASSLLSCLTETCEPVAAGILLLYDSSEGRLRAKASVGHELSSLKHLHLRPGEGPCGRAFETGQPQLLRYTDSIAEALAGTAPANREGFQEASGNRETPVSAICLPLITDGSRIGALLLEGRKCPDSLGPDYLHFLQAISEIIAQFVESAHLACERQTAQDLDEARRFRAELVSTLAHEMRTPLTSVKGYSTALLMDEISFSPETQREFLQFISEGCDILQGLIEDLLESSNIDAGMMRLEPQPVRVPPLVQSVVKELARHTSEHRFLLDFTDDFPIVDADPDRLAQVLRNLLDNAVKYSPDGGLIVVRGQVQKHEILISVADQGVGLNPEHLNRLFEKFFRAKSSLGRHVVGSGLGLPISRAIVESHGGRIWAESQLGEGTTLYFTLPLGDLSQELAEPEETQHE